MYKVDLYIDGQRADLFQDESIEVNLTVQNIKDISKVFGDFSKGFNIPASPRNNAIFKHYYNVDIYGGFDANLRVDAFIEINNNVFRSGLLELESVQMKNNEPQSYQIGFYSNTTALKDLFGEDTLNDLDLSAQDHTYDDTNIQAGIAGYVSGTGDAIIYPMITPVTRWYYDSQGSHGDGNIHFHNDPDHGVFYYDLKPAIKLNKIIDAIETKYGITINSDFFASADFGKLFMWCHRRAGYMFKDQPNGKQGEAIQFTSNTTGDYNLTTQTYTVATAQESDIRVSYSVTSTSDYRIQIFINGTLASSTSHSGTASNIVTLGTLNVGDELQIRFAPPVDWDASAITLASVSADIEYFYLGSWNNGDSVSRVTSQSITQEVIIADQMPEQKITDFLGSLIRQWNLVVVPTAPLTYDIEPLDDWYAEGTTRDITQYIDTEEVTIKRPELYRRIEFKYNETEAILGEEYRLQNDIGYGDLRADFNFDGEEFTVEVGFDNMLFERLTDIYDAGVGLTQLNVGQCVTREEEPYIGKPIVFYAPGTLRVSATYHWSYTEMGTNPSAISKQDMWLIGNVNSTTAADVTQTINFGAEVDPYLLQGFTQSLYQNYWKSYITGLYDGSRRVFAYKANLPLGIMTTLKMNDKLTILERNYLINNVSLNLQTGEATLELLNEA